METDSFWESYVPIWEKPYLTIEEAAPYYNIGVNKLREILDQPQCETCLLWVGSKRLVKRDLFTKYLQSEYSV